VEELGGEPESYHFRHFILDESFACFFNGSFADRQERGRET